MKRFQKLLTDAKGSRAPWEPFPDHGIPAVAAALGASDIADIFVEFERLVQEKAATPAEDGDTHDDIARAQHLFARLLAAVPAALQPHLAGALHGASEDARKWIAIARAECG